MANAARTAAIAAAMSDIRDIDAKGIDRDSVELIRIVSLNWRNKNNCSRGVTSHPTMQETAALFIYFPKMKITGSRCICSQSPTQLKLHHTTT